MQVQLISETPLIRHGLLFLLQDAQDIHVLDTVKCEPVCHHSCCTDECDVLIIDLSTGRHSGIDCIRQISSRHPRTKVIALISTDNFTQTHEVLKNGAKGVLSLNIDASMLTHAIQAVTDGNTFVCPNLAQSIAVMSIHGSNDPFDKLSTREKTVIRLILNGHSHDHCASTLNISKKTVANHYTSIKKKLGFDNMVQLTRMGIRHNIIKV